jgi:hypothetical protein
MVGTPHISTKNIDYLQRAEEEYNPVPLSSLTIQPSSERWRWWHIPEIGRLEKRPTQVPIGERKYNPPTVDLLTSLYGLGSSIGFLVRGAPGQVKIHVGIQESTESQAASSEKRDGNSAVLQSALRSLYPSITTRQAQPKLTSLPLSGLALGIPTVSPPDPVDGAVAIDHLIRSLFEANWACLVLAEPIKESETTSLRKNIVDELRNTEAAQRSLAPETLVKHYSELLEVALSMLTSGLALGMWRTGVYLLGDSQSYHRLASLWRGIFSGDESLPEPLRVWVDSGAAHLAENHILPGT